jgi:glucokinase
MVNITQKTRVDITAEYDIIITKLLQNNFERVSDEKIICNK